MLSFCHLAFLFFFFSLVACPLCVLFFFSLMIRRPPRPTLFPYPTPFRSQAAAVPRGSKIRQRTDLPPTHVTGEGFQLFALFRGCVLHDVLEGPATTAPLGAGPTEVRSEEHTSELQSPDHLVCRLLLE